VPLHQVLGALAIGHAHHGHVRDLGDGTQARLHAGLRETTDGQTQALLSLVPAKRLHTTQSTVQQNGHAVRNLFDLAEDMRGHQDGMGGGKGTDQFAHLNDLGWVKAIGGFVQKEQRRVVEQRLGNGDPLAIPAP